MKKVYFVRHGESELNIGNREQGSAGPLSELGRKQANFIGKRFGKIPVDIIVASPYERTKETSAIVNETLQKDIVYCDHLIERRPPTRFIGVPNENAEYMKVKALMEEKRHVDPAWKYADEDSFVDLRNRAINALSFLKDRKEASILAITHAGILRAIVAVMFFGNELTYAEYLKIYWALKSQNTGITLVEYDEKAHHPGWKLVTWNDHAHLG